MHLPNIFALATRRGVRTKAVVITMALVCTLFSGIALAGQGHSQWCSDNVGNEVHLLNSPVTFNAELGYPVFNNNPGWTYVACFSPTPWGDATPAPTGGAAWLSTTQGASGGSTWANCASDANSTALQFGCNNQVSTNLSSPTSPSGSVASANSINAPGVAGVNTGCPFGYTAGTGGVGCGSGGPSTRYSQWCADGVGNEGPRLIHDPVTLDFELGSSPGNPNYVLTCYSSSPYTSSSEATGGAIELRTPTTTAPMYTLCYSDPAATIRIECATSAEYNPSSNVAHYGVWGQATALNTPVTIPGTTVQAGIGCAGGTVAISVSSCAWGGLLGVSGQGNSSAGGYGYNGVYVPGVAISGLGTTTGAIAATGTGCANSWYLGVSATNCGWGAILGISGTGPAYALGTDPTLPYGAGISGTNDANGSTASVSGMGNANWGQAAMSGAGNAYGSVLAISGIGTANASGNGLIPGVAISGTDAATGRDIAISGSDDAASTIAVSGTENANGGLVSVSGTGCAQGGVAASAIECNPGEGGDPENELVNRSDYTAANCQENTEGNLNSFISTPDPGRLTEPPVYCSGDAAMRAGGYPGAVKAYGQNEIRNQSQVTMGEAEGIADSAAEQAVVLVDTIAGIAMAQYERLSDLEYSLTAEATSLSPGDPLSNLTLCPSGCYVLATNGGSDGGDSLQDFNRHKGVTRMGWDPRKSNGHLDGIYIFNFYFAAYDPRNEWDFYASSMKSSVTPSKARIEEVRTEVKPAKEGLALIDAEPFAVRKYGSAGSMTASASLAGHVKGISGGFSISRTWNFAEGKAGGGMLSNQAVYSLWQGKETTAQGTVGTEVWRIPTSSPVKWTPSAYAIYSCYRWDC